MPPNEHPAAQGRAQSSPDEQSAGCAAPASGASPGESPACTCNPEAYDLGPEGQRQYFPDIACPTHGDPFRDGPIVPDELARRRDEKAE